MPNVRLSEDGSISAARNRIETINYYNRQIEQRTSAMIKLIALGGNPIPVQERIIEINNEKKQKLTGG